MSIFPFILSTFLIKEYSSMSLPGNVLSRTKNSNRQLLPANGEHQFLRAKIVLDAKSIQLKQLEYLNKQIDAMTPVGYYESRSNESEEKQQDEPSLIIPKIKQIYKQHSRHKNSPWYSYNCWDFKILKQVRTLSDEVIAANKQQNFSKAKSLEYKLEDFLAANCIFNVHSHMHGRRRVKGGGRGMRRKGYGGRVLKGRRRRRRSLE